MKIATAVCASIRAGPLWRRRASDLQTATFAIRPRRFGEYDYTRTLPHPRPRREQSPPRGGAATPRLAADGGALFGDPARPWGAEILAGDYLYGAPAVPVAGGAAARILRVRYVDATIRGREESLSPATRPAVEPPTNPLRASSTSRRSPRHRRRVGSSR